MAPLVPDWAQPSHPEIQEVLVSKASDFTTKSLSKVDLAPYAVFSKIAFPPCTPAAEPTYATVQMGRDSHLNLNSDLVYINHSCSPSLIFDMSSMNILVGEKGLKKGDELTFFYPSTEWSMAQGFDCFCGTKACRGFISGAGNMAPEKLEGMWLNAHIRGLLEDRDAKKAAGATNGATNGAKLVGDQTEKALKENILLAKKTMDAAQRALDVYVQEYKEHNGIANGGKSRNGVGNREMSGEMGGDTTATI